MKCLCTTCCKRKRRDAQPLPARKRYLSRRIRFVLQESRRLKTPLLILSGKYGLLTPEQKIPWYDRALLANEVESLSRKLVQQLSRREVSSVVFYARPRKTAGWQPYYAALETACDRLKISLRFKKV